MIDLHCHFLAGIDDGPDSEAESVALAQAWLDRGVGRIVATPHVNFRYPNTAKVIEERRQIAIQALERASLDLRVESGAEVSASFATEMNDDELGNLTLGDSDWLLIEPPTAATPFALHSSIFGISGRGWKILLAHPERNPAIQENLDLLVSLVDGGVKTQVTAGSFSGSYGRTAERTAREMMDRNLVHTIASDAHHATLRPPEMADPLEQAGYDDMVEWLCSDMPRWILDSGTEPRRPARPKKPSYGRRPLWYFGRRR